MIPWVAAKLPRIADAAWNVYGPTETTIWCSGRKMPVADEAEVAASFNNIGPPFSTAEVSRAASGWDAMPHPASPVSSGSAVLPSPAGYHRRDDLTQASFRDVDGTRTLTGPATSVPCRTVARCFYLGRNERPDESTWRAYRTR